MTHVGDVPASRTHWRETSTSLPSRILSLIVSVAVHGATYALLLLVATSLKSCGDGSAVVSEGELREVGIYVKQPTETVEEQETSEQSPELTSIAPTIKENDVEKSVEDEPPIPLDPPLLDPIQTIGIAPPAPVVSQPNLKQFPRPSATLRPPNAAGLGPGETEFFNIRDKGTRFVYLLDRSSSMSSHNALRIAKAELMASLEGLGADQQFQIIFYNMNSSVMRLGGDGTEKLYWATDVNRTLARQFIAVIQPELGTDHLPAIRKALSLEPDILFFLTDAGDPRLDKKDRDIIKRLNHGRTRIHCVEFGEGSNLSEGNFLKKLASENGGTYRYRDIRKFTR